MLKLIFGLLITLALATLALGATFLCGMRAKWPPVVDTVRLLNMRVFNPQQMATAGQPGAYAGIIRHTGRTSGTVYQTPVGIEATDDGFVIALVYGDRTQWLKNVLATGSAQIVHDGETWAVDQPEVVPVEVCDFSATDKRFQCLFGVRNALRLHKVAPAD